MNLKPLAYIKKIISLLTFIFLCLSIFLRQPAYGNETLLLNFSTKFDQREFRAHLSADASVDEAIVKFYLKRSFEPFWYGELAKTQKLLEVIEQSAFHGLPKSKYKILQDKDILNIYQFEVLAMTSLFLLISDLSSGILEPSKVDSAISVYPSKPKEEEIFSKILKIVDNGSNISDLVFSFAPKDLEYGKLLRELDRLTDVIATNGWGQPVPEGKFLGYNLNHSNVGKLRTRLFKMGYLAYDNSSNLFDGELKSAIQLFQADHGLNDDGVAGDFTLQAVNISARTRLIQVIVNLERIRWTDFSSKPKYILVNQPNFQAYLFENDMITWQSRVVIGLPEHQTQEFSDVMTHLIINPVWHVPRSISIYEYLPIIQENPNFLEENDMSLIVRGTTKAIDPKLIDMSQFEPDNFPFLIKQNPSNINALGVVKFMFPNEFNIYMHDTPMKELFFKDERTFSHGCVRVQDPFQFAFNLLSSQEQDPQKKFQDVLVSQEESQINLKEPIPVSLIYRTVFFGNYGQPQYRSDVYGRDAAVFMALQDVGVRAKI